MRGYGCQTALIAERIREATRLGADVIVSLVAPGSPSDRNLARAGMEIACDREIWMPRGWRMHAFYKMVSLVRGANMVRRELGLAEAYVPATDPHLSLVPVAD